jgi:hypothetical protein
MSIYVPKYRKPHTLSVEDLGEMPWQTLAQADTSDNTQTKRLEGQVGSNQFRVRRKYCGHNEAEWQVVFEGSVEEAIRSYNLLS